MKIIRSFEPGDRYRFDYSTTAVWARGSFSMWLGKSQKTVVVGS